MTDTPDSLLIFGAGQYSYVIEDIARLTGRFQKINCLDDGAPLDQRVIGRSKDAERLLSDYSCAIVSIGNPQKRLELTEQLLQWHFEIPILVHPRGWVSPTAVLSPGCVIEADAVVNANACIGLGTFICAGAVINHNATIGKFCQIDCNGTIPARLSIPDGTKVNCGMVYSTKE